MKTTLNDKLIAYLALVSGLSISAVAIYYSVAGLTAIYPASVGPIIVMGIVLELAKLSATVWLKQNWDFAPRFLKAYILPAVAMLMLITSIGIFGFLSKAHSDQNLVSGDVQAKISIYDEKIKTAKENIDADRKQLKQMDEAVDQIMARSTTEGGADKANAVRKSQQRDRSALAKDIETNQKQIASLNDQAAPIRAEVRKVEAEVGPIKYIAQLFYGDNPDANILEKAVNWVTILIVLVFDPLAVILLLASQYSFQRLRYEGADQEIVTPLDKIAQINAGAELEETEIDEPQYEPDDGPLTEEQLAQIQEDASKYLPIGEVITKEKLFPEYKILDEEVEPDWPEPAQQVNAPGLDASDERPGDYLKEAEIADHTPTPVTTREETKIVRNKVFPRNSIIIPLPEETYIQNEEQAESNIWSTTTETHTISPEEYLAKSREVQVTPEENEKSHIDWIVAELSHGRLEFNRIPEELKEKVLGELERIKAAK